MTISFLELPYERNIYLIGLLLLSPFSPSILNLTSFFFSFVVTELVSHFFRNIYNQIKQQVGKGVRETILSIPSSLMNSETIKTRLSEAAQAGGLRIKSFIEDTSSSALAYDVFSHSSPSKILVLDIGWSLTQASILSISGGTMVPLSSISSEGAAGSLFVTKIAEHCAKEFLKKAKFPCSDNTRSMLRLRRECEAAVKAMSTGTEATIDIDSLCEGVDFSCKVSRARFEDLNSIPFMQLKTLLNDVIRQAGLEAANISHVCLGGGLTAVPKVIQILKSILPDAVFPKVCHLSS